MHALIIEGQPSEYPFDIARLAFMHPQTSFPVNPSAAALEAFGVYEVAQVDEPQHDSINETAEQGPPAYNSALGRWEAAWVIRPATAQEVAQRKQAIQNKIVADTQFHLDSFAKTRNYDGILSACTYATSAVPKFQSEGQYCVQARDATWAKLYEMLAEVEAGMRPMPSGFADIEPELPVLEWPTQPE